MALTLSDHCKVTRDSVERAFDNHQESGNISGWVNHHEAKPSRRRPLYTVTLNYPAGGPHSARLLTLDIATLWEAHALCCGLASAERNQV